MKNMHLSLALASTVLAIGFLSGAAQAATESGKCSPELFRGPRANAEVISTRDGDTLDVKIGGAHYGVRLLSVDTPESYYEGRSQGEWAVKAKRLLKNMLETGDIVELEFDQDRCDYYGRILAYVHKGSLDVNKEMLRKGMAVNFCVYPNFAHCDEYQATVRQAMLKHTGIWSDSSFEEPYAWRARIRGTPPASCVGDLPSRRVFPMKRMSDVSVDRRVFFMSRNNEMCRRFARR